MAGHLMPPRELAQDRLLLVRRGSRLRMQRAARVERQPDGGVNGLGTSPSSTSDATQRARAS